MCAANRQLVLVLVVIGCAWNAGCGSSDSEPTADSENAQAESTASALPAENNSLPLAALGGNAAQPAASQEPKPGTPEAILAEIKALRMARPSSTADGPVDVEKLRVERRARNLKIVDLATEAIEKTHDKADREAAFNQAVNLLLQARLQLAASGQPDDIDALYADVQSLKARDPKSPAAADAAHYLVLYANGNARRFGREEPAWFREFADQARLFAREYPEDPRAVPALFAAGLSCELHGHLDLAMKCFSTIQQSFPQAPESQRVVPILRRLNLVGRALEFKGPTIEGNYVGIDDWRGRPVVIVYWSSENPQFREMLPQLLSITTRYQDRGVQFVGVCLDEDESQLDAFLVEHGLTWTQMFDPQNRRWDNRIVKYYGLRAIPAIWVVDQQGIVRTTHSTPEKLTAQLDALLRTQP